MSGPLRSKQGCWTCRLRRKKCDERRDFCQTCESLSISCYGYGPKPDWMDNGEKEKAMASSIKQIVKHTSRRRGRLGTTITRFQERYGGQKNGGNVVKIAPKSRELVPDTSDDSPPLEPAFRVESRASGPLADTPPASMRTGTESLSPEANPSLSFPNAESCELPSRTPLTSVPISEAVLLMHFLDNVFPLQHPMYKPGVAEGGRGWLLSLLLRTKPLYHASLALSAYHRGSVMLANQRYKNPCSSAQQEKHLAICLEEFQQAIKDVGTWVMLKVCPKDSLGLMASVVQLIYFELFAGHGQAWKIHLRAATDSFLAGYWNESSRLGLMEPAESDEPTLLAEDVARDVASEQLASFKFLCGVILWLDILETVTTGKAPHLISIHAHALNPISHIRLETIIGCKNWPILQIGRIAALYERKIQVIQCSGCENTAAELEAEVSDIRQKLQYGLTEQAFTCLAVTEAEAYSPHHTPSHHQAVITRLFALAASIYLDLVVHGFQREACASATEAMMILRAHMPLDLLHVVIFPLYIIGYVAATPEDQQFFRCVFSSSPVLDPSLEHRNKILPLLEDIWQKRDTMLDGNHWEVSLRRLSESNLLLL